MDESNDTRLLRLDHRHLAFFFLGAVAVCAIFFSLGFVVGRGQAYEAALKELPSAARIAELKPTDLAPEPNSPLEPSFAEGVSSSPNLSTNSGKPERKGPPGADYRPELDFYSAVKGKNVDENFHPGADGAETGS